MKLPTSLMHDTTLKKLPIRTSFKTMAVVLAFLAAQILGIFHLVEHSIEGDNDGCEICVSIAHSGTFSLPAPVLLPLPAEQVQQITNTDLSHCYESRLAVYSSRAPPISA